MAYENLLSPFELGRLTLSNRVIMAPLTRARTPDSVPGELQARYYAQRAGAGLVISEATNISPTARGYVYTPGIYTDAQEEGWRKVVKAVHDAGGRMALQLWHVGRVSHEIVQPNGLQPVAPSAIRGEGAQCFAEFADGTAGRHPASTPRALELKEIPTLIEDYRQAARRAKRAAFDMLEVHAANAYLLQQFLASGANKRTDRYGGSVVNRARLLLEVVDAVSAEIGADRVGVRLSPFIEIFGLSDDEPEAMMRYLAEQLSLRKIGYLHINEPDWTGEGVQLTDDFRRDLRDRFRGPLLYCGHYTAARGEVLIAKGLADAVVYGRPYIANPDLVERFRRQAPLNEPDPDTFYGGGAQGYTDYPTLD
ncbi:MULTISPECIES: alkene reductase [Halomonadaceae]|mgnify:CR=1 FL=1|uniref:Alkene reductase n=1 Tax=Modicisalibacter zincidurans TaxID=1178777 RepID=A0ABP9R552_9GAMM|nr:MULTISPECIES: alkene reductase [Halomonas]MCD6008695.1 alkene reductase [Halomonas sp. IOP_31]